MESIGAEKPFQCELCDKTFTSKNARRTHYLIHTGELPYVCCICGKGFRKKYVLQEHEKSHSLTKPHKCPHCPFQTAHERYLPMHIATQHTKNYSHVCSVCSKGFFKRPDLETHMKEQHLITFKCDVYNVTFTSVFARKRYKKCSEQTDGKSHSEECPFSPDYKGNSEHHLPPSGEQLYRCMHCEEGFALKSHLRTHLRVCGRDQTTTLPDHEKSPVQKFRCTVCPYSTNRKTNLRYHAVTHSSKLPFKCNLCQKTFAQKGHFQTHMIIHSGVRPYKCFFCGKGFYRIYHMQRHEEIHAKALKSEISS